MATGKINGGVLPINFGGTGQTSLAGLRDALGLGTSSGPLSPENGGTGQTSLQALRNALGLGNTLGVLPIANGGTGGSDSGWYTITNSSVFTYKPIYYRRIGKFATVVLDSVRLVNKLTSDSVVLATLPSDFRPHKLVVTTLGSATAGVGGQILHVKENGNVVIYRNKSLSATSVPASTNINAAVLYITA